MLDTFSFQQVYCSGIIHFLSIVQLDHYYLLWRNSILTILINLVPSSWMIKGGLHFVGCCVVKNFPI